MMNNFDYSVRVKNGAGWRKFNRARLMISVGKEYHEGKKLEAAVAWINRNPCLTEIHISVNDVLQRHNFLATGMGESEALGVSLMAGTSWIERNEEILTQIKPLTHVTRWNDWFLSKDFSAVHDALIQYPQRDPSFGIAVETDAHALAERKTKRGEAVHNFNKLVAHSRSYILEELAVFALQTRDLPAAEVYPGTNLASAQNLIAKTLPTEIAPLAERYFTRIDFAKINAITPADSTRNAEYISA